jgi:fucokinase
MIGRWDYLVVTASNAAQAAAYERQLAARRIEGVGETLVVADLEGRRIGSGGSTLLCLIEILNRERARRGIDFRAPGAILRELGRLRILIIHAGGDSRRLPAYSPCGKIFVPLPGESGGSVPAALFDRLAPEFLRLPGAPGQVLVAAGDALTRFDARDVAFDRPGLTALACYATPEEASRHGVFCPGPDSTVSLYLQKPSLALQQAAHAVNGDGLTPLDIGVMSLDASASAALLAAFGVGPVRDDAQDDALAFDPFSRERLLRLGVDLYREICCAMGTAATPEHYIRSTGSSGSKWTPDQLGELFPALHAIPFHVAVVAECRFLHFGSSRQLIESGLELLSLETGAPPASTVLTVNCAVTPPGLIRGRTSWVEGCRVHAALDLEGRNLVAGVDVETPLSLPSGASLEVLPGHDRSGARTWFVRCYGIDDTFKRSIADGGEFCGRGLLDWLARVGVAPDAVWPDTQDAAGRSLWNARVFVAVQSPAGFRDWLWMYAPELATSVQLEAYRAAERYSAAEIALLTDQDAFHARRASIWQGAPATSAQGAH